MMSGLNGFLRQEFRELELLDRVTHLRFKDKLPRSVTGLYCGKLLCSYKAWKGDHVKDPDHFHDTIKYNPIKD
ncbi:hypothetical protein B0H17DRAFT_1238231, partial [Mycena rosella]